MPANPRNDQIVNSLDPTDLVPVSLRGSSDRADKTAGYIDRTWYVSVSDLATAVATDDAEAIATALLADSDFIDGIVAASATALLADSDFVDALVALLDNYVEPDWTTI
jgi:hypothetical protein